MFSTQTHRLAAQAHLCWGAASLIERIAMSLVTTKGVQHIGIPVSNLERSLEWYAKVLGIVETFRVDGSGPEVSELLQVEKADLTAVFLRVGDLFIELLEHRNPGRP